MGWNTKYNYLYEEFKLSSFEVFPFYFRIGTWDDDLIVIATIMLVISSTKTSAIETFETENALKFLEIGKINGANMDLINYLNSMIKDLSISNTSIDCINTVKRLIINGFEFQIILFFIKYKSSVYDTRISVEHILNEIQTEIEKNIDSENDNCSLSPYLYFLQTIKYRIIILQLRELELKSKWSVYLSTSFQLLYESVFDLSPSNGPFLEWYLSTSEIPYVISTFLKSLLLEPYGYLKYSTIENIRSYFLNVGKLNIIKSIRLSSNNQAEKILKSISFGKIFKLSNNNHTLNYIKCKILNYSEDQFKNAYENLIELNVVNVSRKFSTVKLSTLLKLFDLDAEIYSSADLLDIILKLSENKKIVVKIDQCDETLTFPLHDVNDTKSLDLMFSQVLPQALERDWSKMI
ncbi:hypothetical protein C6P40_000418 [Pichia californica]|uniref:PCI domain-containing protein n=1 Tax=Pichia californica TaxID=460514 RepID=A0A9P7BFE4_9ASCO|nr:hypothetical protein C6P42_005473 [[Candida] californica]KAG0688861.1 hypothetical protein C6P40_000418 [[Candida] californica]